MDLIVWNWIINSLRSNSYSYAIQNSLLYAIQNAFWAGCGCGCWVGRLPEAAVDLDADAPPPRAVASSSSAALLGMLLNAAAASGASALLLGSGDRSSWNCRL
jgi:hypothetical protein